MTALELVLLWLTVLTTIAFTIPYGLGLMAIHKKMNE